MPHFLCPSPRSPTGNLLGKRRLPPHLSRHPTIDIKKDSRSNGLSLPTTDCQAFVLRPSCESTLYINQGDLVLSPDMDACKTTPEPYIAALKLAPPLNQVFQNVPFDRLNFPSYPIGPARKSILESVQLELTEIPDVRRKDPEILQKLTEPIVAHYTSLNPATAAALDNFVPVKTSFLIAGGSILLSLFLLTLNFPLFHRQARALCCPRIVSSRTNLANLFMSRTTLNQTQTLHF